MIATIELPLNGETRNQIMNRMSEAMGSYIEAKGVTDFADWRQEDWDSFISCAFDICASEVFRARIVVVPPALFREPGQEG